MMTSANWDELFTPELTEAFFIGYDGDGSGRVSMIPTLFKQTTSERQFEKFLSFGAFGREGWGQFEKTGRVSYDERRKGYDQTVTHKEFAEGFMVERKMIDDKMQDIYIDSATDLGDSAFLQRENSAANIFENSFTDSGNDEEGFPIAGPDSVGLCSTAHPYSPEDSTTQSNEGTYVFTPDNIELVRQAMIAFTDDRGNFANVRPNMMLTPPELSERGLVWTGSPDDPTTPNRAINSPALRRFQIQEWEYLTDAKNWWMLDVSRMKRHLMWLDRIALEFKQETDFDTYTKRYAAYMRYSRAFRDWRFCYGNQPA